MQNLGLRLFVVDVDHTVYVVVLGIEIEHCSIAYFNCLILKGSCALYRGVRYICMYVVRMSPALNRNFALLCFKCDYVIEQNNVGFRPGLPHMCTYLWQSRVELNGYSVMYFNCIAAFDTPYH